MKELPKYSMGIGDRFGCEGLAQLEAFTELERRQGVVVTPVWNKSSREHLIVGTKPESVRREADEAVRSARWTHPYFVDADHIGLSSVDAFVEPSDFFTLDVADYIGETMDEGEIYAFVARHESLIGTHVIEGLPAPLTLTRPLLAETVRNILFAVRQAGRLYRHIVEKKGGDDFVAEISMDEASVAQTPAALLVILAAVAEERIPLQTIAPKFSGSFNKGVDYSGSAAAFGKEFDADACVVREAVRRFGLPGGLKLSVHSGSDKFSLYPHIAHALKTRGVGVHVKTSGTTWLEELAGLAIAGGEGLAIAKEIYARARPRLKELCAPYAGVIALNQKRLPRTEDVETWDGARFAGALRNAPEDSRYSPGFRQFLHVAYKVAAELGERYLGAVKANRNVVARHVTANLYERHLKPIFGELGG